MLRLSELGLSGQLVPKHQRTGIDSFLKRSLEILTEYVSNKFVAFRHPSF
jgi:hypothetical protein